jgi:hypothetical protein
LATKSIFRGALKAIPNHPVCSPAYSHATTVRCVVVQSRQISRSPLPRTSSKCASHPPVAFTLSPASLPSGTSQSLGHCRPIRSFSAFGALEQHPQIRCGGCAGDGVPACDSGSSGRHMRDTSDPRAPSPSAESMEHLILAALEARSGGDLVYRRNHKSGRLFRLAPGIHDMQAVARGLAERSRHINAKWMRRFYRAWRALCDSGALEAPSLIPIAEAFPACQRRVHHLGEGAYIDGGRNRFYVSLTGRAAPPPPPTECGVDLHSTQRLRKWCATCKAKLIKHRNVQARVERSSASACCLQPPNASAAARILPQ